jgi:hypothetical protein
MDWSVKGSHLISVGVQQCAKWKRCVRITAAPLDNRLT